ncbi:MAG: peptidase M28 [Bacteroidetes bacterium]|nr:MAG: peptidase M28 [Bacteroidota bacterium]
MRRLWKTMAGVSLVLICGVCMVTNPVLFAADTEVEIIRVDPEKLKSDVVFLATLQPARHSENTASLDSAASWIRAQLSAEGIISEEQVYEAGGKKYRNIICSFGPDSGERIIAGAHYDVCGERPGADDNASGTAGLLEIARQLKRNSAQLAYRTDLVFYTLEEPPYFRTTEMGSAVHARSLKAKDIKVKTMICLEMIGYFSDAEDSQEYPVKLLKLFYPDKANYIAVVGKFGQGRLIRNVKRKMNSAMDLDVRSINAPASLPGIDFSDHLNYWAEGYDAVMITNTAFYRNKNYHEPTDTPETLDYKRMAEVVKGVYNVIVQMK